MIIPHLAATQPEDRLSISFFRRITRRSISLRRAGVSGVETPESLSGVSALVKGMSVFKSEIKKIFSRKMSK